MTSALCVLLAALLQLAPADSTSFLERGTMELGAEGLPSYAYRVWTTPDSLGVIEFTSSDGGAIRFPAHLASSFDRIYNKHFGGGPVTAFGWDVMDGFLVFYVQQTMGIRTAWVYLALTLLLAVGGGAALWAWQRRRRRRSTHEVHAHQIASREAERARVSREIHDGPVQDLAALALALDAVDTGEAADLRERLRGVTRELRTLAEGLRPPVLDRFGLARALRDLSDRPEGMCRGLDVEVRAEPVALDAETELALYRVAQEALTNAARHSDATRAELSLDADADGVSLTVRDDGRGFGRRPSLDALVQRGHFGLAGMRERVRLVGGTLDLADAPDGGATVVARVPRSPGAPTPTD